MHNGEIIGLGEVNDAILLDQRARVLLKELF